MEAQPVLDPESSDNDVNIPEPINSAVSVAEEDSLRAQVYGLLSRVLALPMSDSTLAILRGLADVNAETELGAALKSLGTLATRTPRAVVEDEYSALFYGMGSGGELHPYASYYLTGFVYEKPLADLRRELTEMGIETAQVSDEPEDHIAFLMEVMHGLIMGHLGGSQGAQRQQAFFMHHIAPWAGPFFKDLEKAKNAKVYMPVGTLGGIFMALENEAFEMIAI